MHKKLSLLICVLSVSACGGSGNLVCPDPPKAVTLAPLSAKMMQTPTFGSSLRAEFLDTGTKPTSGLSGSKPN
jgi:hypothetical protein